VVQYQTQATETPNSLQDHSEEFHKTEEVFTTYQTSEATDSITHVGMKDRNVLLKAGHAIEHDEMANHAGALSCTQTYTERQMTKSTNGKSTIPQYTNVTLSTSSKFTSCCVMRIQFCALDT